MRSSPASPQGYLQVPNIGGNHLKCFESYENSMDKFELVIVYGQVKIGKNLVGTVIPAVYKTVQLKSHNVTSQYK